MSRQGYDLGDYNDVASRIQEFREKHPTGSLQPADPGRPYSLEILEGKTFVIVVTAAYRTPDDPRPGIGMAWEPVPGLTPYTRGSEIQNAETSSWGRALIAVGAADARKGIASAEEVQARRQPSRQRSTSDTGGTDGPVSRETGPQQGDSAPRLMSQPQQRKLMLLLKQAGHVEREQRLAYCSAAVGRELASSSDLTLREAAGIIDGLEQALKESHDETPGGPA